MDPITPQFQERDVVAFHVVDGAEGDSARGDWVGEWQGVIRPLLQWNTRFTPEESRSDSEMTEGLGRNSK
jgi:lipopolysaccharide transport system ATP-binding protein